MNRDIILGEDSGGQDLTKSMDFPNKDSSVEMIHNPSNKKRKTHSYKTELKKMKSERDTFIELFIAFWGLSMALIATQWLPMTSSRLIDTFILSFGAFFFWGIWRAYKMTKR